MTWQTESCIKRQTSSVSLNSLQDEDHQLDSSLWLFWAEKKGNHQNFETNDNSYETPGCFHWKKTILLLFEKKIKMAD